MANRYPLVVDTTNNNKIKEIPNGDNLLLTGNSITGVIDITASGNINVAGINITGTLTYQGNPLTSIATTSAYSDLTGVPTNVSQFANDASYRSNGDNVSVFTNDAGYLTTVAFTDLTTTPTTLGGYGIIDAATSIQGSLATSALQPGANISGLNNDSGFVTLSDLQNGVVTVDVNNSGDLVGSVFADNSTTMIDSILASVNLDGTIRGHVTPNANQHNTWDLGTDAVRFKNAYFAGTINGAHVGTLDGDVEGSVFADNSTTLVDGVAGKIVGDIETASLRTSESEIALGGNAGATNQGYAGVSIGQGAGGGNQGAEGVAIGLLAGSANQGAGAVAIGNAGTGYQGAQAVAIGYTAATVYQGIKAVAVGFLAGGNNQGASAIAIGDEAGRGGEATATYVSGGEADTTLIVDDTSGILTGARISGIGFPATVEMQPRVLSVDNGTTLTIESTSDSTPSGVLTFNAQQFNNAVGIGFEAGAYGQQQYAVALGYGAGKFTQDEQAVAVGANAGNNNQGLGGVAIGIGAGQTNQDNHSIAVGKWSGQTNQANEAIAIGYGAGQTGQGENAIALGQEAGNYNQAANSIVINATGAIVDNPTASSLRITPIRSASGTTTLMYDATTGEVTHTATPAQQTMIGSVQQISGPGAIDVTSYITEITTTGTNDAYTLADGVAGQIKIIVMVVDGGDAIITPTTLATGTNITMADVNDNITLLYGANGWSNTANQGSIIA